MTKLQELSPTTPSLGVAQYIINYFKESNQDMGSFTHLKLQKLLYFVYGWSLVYLDKPIFDGTFQAWINGPVCKTVYDKYSSFGVSPIDGFVKEFYISLSDDEESLITSVLTAYAGLTAWQLVGLTHKEGGAWHKTRAGISSNEHCSRVIDIDLIREEFESLKNSNG